MIMKIEQKYKQNQLNNKNDNVRYVFEAEGTSDFIQKIRSNIEKTIKESESNTKTDDLIIKIKNLVLDDICKSCPYDDCLNSNTYPCTEKQILELIESEQE